MNSEQRILAALRREQPDRVPICLWLNPYDDKRWAVGVPNIDKAEVRESYAEILEVAKECADARYNWTFPQGFFHTAFHLETSSRELSPGVRETRVHTPKGDLTSVVGRTASNSTYEMKHYVKTPQDWERLQSIPYQPSQPDLTEFLAIREKLRGLAVGQITFRDPVSWLSFLGSETAALWTIDHRDLLFEMLDVSLHRILDQMDYLLAHDAGPIYYINGPERGLPPLMSPRDFEEFVFPYDAQIIARIKQHGKYVEVHCHGRVNRFLEQFIEIGADGLNPLEPPPKGDVILSDAKARVGGKICLIGNVQYEDIVSGTKADVERLVVDCIRAGAPGGGFILTPSAGPYESPLPRQTAENWIHFMRMGRKHGEYPIQ